MHIRSSSPTPVRKYEPIPLPEDFPITGGSVYRQPDTPITRLHLHNCLEIGYCHEGHGIFMVEGKILPYRTGDVSVITEREMHLAQSTPGTFSDWTFLQFDPVRLCRVGAEDLPYFSTHALAGSFRNIISGEESPDLSHLAESLTREMREKKEGYREAVRGLVRALMVALHRLTDKTPDTQPVAHQGIARVAPALQAIGARYAEPLRMEELARLCHVSLAHFRRLFTDAVGQSPKQYLGNLRVQMAAGMLRATDSSILQIALDCGYPTLSTFNRAFRAAMGVSPRTWRRQG